MNCFYKQCRRLNLKGGESGSANGDTSRRSEQNIMMDTIWTFKVVRNERGFNVHRSDCSTSPSFRESSQNFHQVTTNTVDPCHTDVQTPCADRIYIILYLSLYSLELVTRRQNRGRSMLRIARSEQGGTLYGPALLFFQVPWLLPCAREIG